MHYTYCNLKKRRQNIRSPEDNRYLNQVIKQLKIILVNSRNQKTQQYQSAHWGLYLL